VNQVLKVSTYTPSLAEDLPIIVVERPAIELAA
jgi:hypothetical protein